MLFKFNNKKKSSLADLSKINSKDESCLNVYQFLTDRAGLKVYLNGIPINMQDFKSNSDLLYHLKDYKKYYLNNIEVSTLNKMIYTYGYNFLFLGQGAFNAGAYENNIEFNLDKYFNCSISSDKDRQGVVITEKFYIKGFKSNQNNLKEVISKEDTINKEDSSSSNSSGSGAKMSWIMFLSSKKDTDLDSLKNIPKKIEEPNSKINFNTQVSDVAICKIPSFNKDIKDHKLTAPNNSEETLEKVGSYKQNFTEELITLDTTNITSSQKLQDNIDKGVVKYHEYDFEPPIYENKKDNIVTIESFFSLSEDGNLQHKIIDVNLKIYDNKIANLFKNNDLDKTASCICLPKPTKFRI